MAETASLKKIHILAPFYNEGEGILLFLDALAESMMKSGMKISVDIYLVDDGSADRTAEYALSWKSPSEYLQLYVIRMSRNMGHQQAIRHGLIHLSEIEDLEAVIVMDSDGEDDPDAIPELLQAYNGQDIIFVNRGKRKENLIFRVSYFFYKLLFRLITGNTITFGNFCLLSRRMAKEVADDDFIHFAAVLSKKKVNRSGITKDRKKRLMGSSKMRYMSLVNHAFNSLVVYSEDLIFMFLKFSAFMITICFIMILYILYSKLFTNNAILGWASVLAVGFFNASLISLGFFVIGLMLIKIRYLTKNSGTLGRLECMKNSNSDSREKKND